MEMSVVLADPEGGASLAINFKHNFIRNMAKTRLKMTSISNSNPPPPRSNPGIATE